MHGADMNYLSIAAWLNPGRWLLLIGLAGALTIGYFAWRGNQREIGRDEVRAQYAIAAQKNSAKREAVSAPISLKFARQTERIRTVTKTIIKEVPTYVSANDCPLSPGFRVFHDAAANGELPDPARIADAAAVPAPAVANAVADNYGTCLENAKRLEGLQEWVRAQQKLKP